MAGGGRIMLRSGADRARTSRMRRLGFRIEPARAVWLGAPEAKTDAGQQKEGASVSKASLVHVQFQLGAGTWMRTDRRQSSSILTQITMLHTASPSPGCCAQRQTCAPTT